MLSNPLRYAFDEAAKAATQFAGPSTPTSRRWPRTRSRASRARDFYSPTQATFANGMHAAIVETDPETAEITILRYCVVHDCGTLINPMIVEGQVHGGVAQGVGGALYERMAYDESGQLLNASFMDFLMPYASEVPHIETDHLETPSPLNPLGIKGAGEAGVHPGRRPSSPPPSRTPRASRSRRMPISPVELWELRQPPRGRRDPLPAPPLRHAHHVAQPGADRMKISGAATLTAPTRSRSGTRSTTRRCWLAASPAASGSTEVGPDHYAMTVTAGVAAIKGTYDGEVSPHRPAAPRARSPCKASGAGAPGTVDADVKVPPGSARRQRRHRPHLRRRRLVGGVIGGVGQRMLAGVTQEDGRPVLHRASTATSPASAGRPAAAAAPAVPVGADGRARRSGRSPGVCRPRRLPRRRCARRSTRSFAARGRSSVAVIALVGVVRRRASLGRRR